MNVDEAIRSLGAAEGFPREAMQWALDNWDAASPRLIAKVRALYSRSEPTEAEREAAFYIVHLCGQMRDTRIYTTLCHAIANDPKIEEWLGGGVDETLLGMLINVCDGDVEPLQRAVESEAGDEYARAAALQALSYLVRVQGLLSDEDMSAWLSRLGREMKPDSAEFLWSTWMFMIASLGYEALRADVARMLSRGLVAKDSGDLPAFYERLQLARRDPAGLAGFEADRIRPFGSAIETLESWGDGPYESEAEEDLDYSTPDLGTPYVNPLRDVGRNDPCPCGSGKKFKKCHGAA